MPRSIVPPFNRIAPPRPASEAGGKVISLIIRGWKRFPKRIETPADRFVLASTSSAKVHRSVSRQTLYRVAASSWQSYSRSSEHSNVGFQGACDFLQSPCVHRRADVEVKKRKCLSIGPRTKQPSSKLLKPPSDQPVTLASNPMKRSRHREDTKLETEWLYSSFACNKKSQQFCSRAWTETINSNTDGYGIADYPACV